MYVCMYVAHSGMLDLQVGKNIQKYIPHSGAQDVNLLHSQIRKLTLIQYYSGFICATDVLFLVQDTVSHHIFC